MQGVGAVADTSHDPSQSLITSLSDLVPGRQAVVCGIYLCRLLMIPKRSQIKRGMITRAGDGSSPSTPVIGRLQMTAALTTLTNEKRRKYAQIQPSNSISIQAFSLHSVSSTLCEAGRSSKQRFHLEFVALRPVFKKPFFLDVGLRKTRNT